MANNIPDDWMSYDDIVSRSEFELYNIMPDIHFPGRLQRRCRRANITGYIVFADEECRAVGVMEGLREDINAVKRWILKRCIPEPFEERATFSAFEMCFNPNRMFFRRLYSVPQEEHLLGDLFEASMTNPKEEMKIKQVDSDNYESDAETVVTTARSGY